MEKAPIKAEIKKKYEEFVFNTKVYHEKMTVDNDPDDMYFQYATRSEILGNLSDLLGNFTNNSHWILDAFDAYKESLRKSGVNIDFSFFTEFINNFIKLLSNKEELSIWFDEVYSDVKFLEGEKAFDMSKSDIIIRENQ